MLVYLVSLIQDGDRRAELERNMPKLFSRSIHVEAVDGRELRAKDYYSNVLSYYKQSSILMSPSELGCTLSHIKALEMFLEANEDNALVIEDDVSGDDSVYEKIDKIFNTLPSNSILICGGQEGLKSRRFQVGKNVAEGVFRVSKFSHDYILRTCCYVVSRDSAKHILAFHENGVAVADNWGGILKGTDIDIYYSELLSHPDDLSVSHIEKERNEIKSKPLLEKIFSVGVFFILYRKVRERLLVVLLKLLGYKRININKL